MGCFGWVMIKKKEKENYIILGELIGNYIFFKKFFLVWKFKFLIMLFLGYNYKCYIEFLN